MATAERATSRRRQTRKGWPDAEAYCLDEHMGYMLSRAFAVAHTKLRDQIAELDITPAQHVVIMRLFELEKVSQNDLGRRVGMKRATIHGVVKRMEQRGIVRTSENPDDQRLIMVKLTRKGKDLANELALRSTEASDASVARLTEREQASLRRLLNKINTEAIPLA